MQLSGEPVDWPIRFAEVCATLYHNLGIDVERTTVRDLHGRPQYLVDGHWKSNLTIQEMQINNSTLPFSRCAFPLIPTAPLQQRLKRYHYPPPRCCSGSG